jgi:hypothetical protein
VRFRLGLVVFALALGGATGSSVGASSAAAVPVSEPLVEDFAHPGAADIEATRGFKVFGGDGNILVVDCPPDFNVDMEMVKVETYGGVGNVCLEVTGPVGYLALEVPSVYMIETDSHAFDATLRGIDGSVKPVELDADDVNCEWAPGASPGCPNPVGAWFPGAPAVTMLELSARRTSGIEPGLLPVASAQHAVGRVTVGIPGRGAARSCTATLISPSWVLSAASCFGGPSPLSAGEPPVSSTVSFGGQALRHVVQVVPRSDRDVVLAKLDRRVTGIAPVSVGAAAPATGASVPLASFGRTATAWLPDGAGTVSASVTALSATTVTMSSAGPVCKGAAGGPARDASGALTGIVTLSGQQGCLGETGTDSEVIVARTDDIKAWIATAIQVSATNGDYRGEALAVGDVLARNQYLASESLVTQLVFQGDSNLVLYNNGVPLWSAGTYGLNGTRVVMQSDGNLVMYRADNSVAWHTATWGHPGAYLRLQADGNVMIRQSETVVWSTGTGRFNPPTRVASNKLTGGQILRTNQYLRSLDGRYALLLQPDGNLVLYSRGYHVLWNSGTPSVGVDRLVMQGDGNLVLYSGGTPRWDTVTYGVGADRAVIQDDGNFVVYARQVPRWDTHTAGKI